MSRRRVVIAAALVAIVAALFVWQRVRERRLEDCLADGGAWNGPASRCVLPPRTILQRDLQRG